MDLVARCIIATFDTPTGIRRDAALEIVLEGPPNPPVSMTIDGGSVGGLLRGEVSVATAVYECLSGREVPGMSLKRRSFAETLRKCTDGGYTLYYLHEEGADSRSMSFAERPAFILGDHKGLDPASERLLDSIGAIRVSLGPPSYLASHCITMVNCLLDMVNR